MLSFTIQCLFLHIFFITIINIDTIIFSQYSLMQIKCFSLYSVSQCSAVDVLLWQLRTLHVRFCHHFFVSMTSSIKATLIKSAKFPLTIHFKLILKSCKYKSKL